jgi:hypothetical protein
MIKMTKSIFFVGILILIFSGMCIASDKDLIAYWNFDEGSGQIVKDQTGNGHDGKLVSDPKWIQGKFGKALEFDGKSNYVEVPDSPDLAIEANATYATWFKPSVTINSANNNYRMISKNNDYFLLFNYEKLGQLGFLVKDPGGTNHVVHSNTNEWKEGEWYHAAGTFDGKELKIYINGDLENTLAYNGKAGTSKLALWIGADDIPNYFQGAIDEFRIYKRALTDNEIKPVMNNPDLAVQPFYESITTTWGNIKCF